MTKLPLRSALWGAAFLMAAILGFSAHAFELAPFKDQLFTYPPMLSQTDNGASAVADYRIERDIYQRDEQPERRVSRRYIDLAPLRMQEELSLETEAGKLRYFAVGTALNAKIITLYLHGQGGNRHQGVNDYTFGGNFNRIKNLMTRNDGLYLVPDVVDFGSYGAAQITALIDHYQAHSPDARIFIACGSMGGALCWKLADNAQLMTRMGGFLFLGSMWNDNFRKTAAFRLSVPLFLAHGSLDTVFPIDAQAAFYKTVRKASLNYPIRFIRFETGSHGTPIRMIDWRQTINWMLSVSH